MYASLPPGPRSPWPAQLFRYVYRTTAFLDACAARFGDVFTLRLGDAGTLVVVHAPEHVREVFTADAAVLQAGRSNVIARPIVGERSVFVLDGASHLHLRRLLLPPFHGDRMRSYAGIVEDAVHRRVDRWRPGQRFAIHRDMQDVTLDVILRAVFGLTDDAERERLRAALVQLFAPTPAIFSFLPSLQIDRPASPFRLWLRRRGKVMAMLDALVAERRRQPDLAAREDILSLLLLARDDDGRGLSDAELRDQLVTLLVAGHETTATALAWVFERVLCHPEVEARLRDELESAGGLGNPDPALVEKLPFLDAVLKEVARQRPVLPLVARGLAAPWAVAGYELPAGVIVAPCLYLTHRRPELYPEPDAFRPDRWLEGRPDPHHYYPFGGGLRRCLGMSFALYEMKLVLAAVLSRCRLTLARPGPLRVTRRTITLWPEGGTPVLVEGVAAR